MRLPLIYSCPSKPRAGLTEYWPRQALSGVLADPVATLGVRGGYALYQRHADHGRRGAAPRVIPVGFGGVYVQGVGLGAQREPLAEPDAGGVFGALELVREVCCFPSIYDSLDCSLGDSHVFSPGFAQIRFPISLFPGLGAPVFLCDLK